MSEMTLFRDNKFPWKIDETEVMRKFVESPLFRENNRPENVRFALFIARQEPAGLQSTFRSDEFTRAYDLFTQMKHKLL